MGSEREWKCDDPGHRAVYAAATSEALRCLAGKWKIVVLCELFAKGALRFSELERSVERVTQKMLIQQLKELERDGIVKRTAYPRVPPKVEYSLTDIGHALGPAIAPLMDWAQTRRRVQSGT
jgi:DNA-binding HxlR family transcriptional regulator